MNHAFRSLALASSLCLLACTLVSCGPSKAQQEIDRDPEGALKNPELTEASQVAAIDEIWSRKVNGRDVARETMKSWAWKYTAPFAVRKRAIEHLLNDPQDADHADTRAMARLMLPPEPSPAIAEVLCMMMAEQGWRECAPAIVRSWAKVSVSTENPPQMQAMKKLFADTDLADAVYQVFATPVTGAGTAKERGELARSAAWDVLTRLDPTGRKRLDAIKAGAATTTSDPLITDLRAAVEQLRVMPITANQLEWLRQMRRFDAPGKPADGAARRAWWSETAALLARMPESRTGPIHMRNLEALRLAAKTRPVLINADREALLSTLRERLAGRTIHSRAGGGGGGGTPFGSERLIDHEASLTWADLVTIIVIDEVMKDDSIRSAVWNEIVRDIKAPSTELGGLIHTESGSPILTPYDPRPVERRNDEKYVAPDDLFSAGPLALCHYHFHAQRIDNREYAGPGVGDAQFARDQGRACILITPIGDRRFNIDYYHGGDVTIDLGEFKAP